MSLPHSGEKSLSVAAEESSANAARQEQQLQWMDPKSIRFTQRSISSVFRRTVSLLKNLDGFTSYAEALKAANESLHGLLEKLREGVVRVEEIPPIRVCFHENSWYSLDNRRLWVFRELGQQIPVQVTDASKEFFKKLDLSFDGESVCFSGSESTTSSFESQSLVREVLKWSLEDIQNERLFVNQAKAIPLEFLSVRRYLNSFLNLLLEEFRASLQQSLELIDDKVVFLLKSNQRMGPAGEDSFRSFKLDVEHNKRRTLKPTDLVMLTTADSNLSTRLRAGSGEMYTLALLTPQPAVLIADGEDIVYKATVYLPASSPEYQSLIDGERAWYVVYLNNLATAMRIWSALKNPLVDSAEFRILDEVLKARPALSDESFVPVELRSSQLRVASWFNLNESQMRAVSRTITALENNRRPLVRLIQGPPGTGKTTMLIALLSVLASSGHKTLMCAPTNAAIIEVVTRFYRAITHESAPASILPGDIVLLGNKDNLGVENNEVLSSLFLPNRVKRLSPALKSWRNDLISLAQFLSSASESYDLYLEIQQHAKDPVKSFREFVQKNIEALGEKMITSVESLCNDLPRVFLSSTSILGAKQLLIELYDSVAGGNESEETLRGWFDTKSSCDEVEPVPVVKTLRALRDLLKRNLNFVKYPADKQVISRILLANASVVFCTVSSAGKDLVQQVSPPFDLAIVDEASQVVEAATSILLGIESLRQLVLVGDHHQLPATVFSKVALECHYGRSLFQRLQLLDHPSLMLNTQYRMHPFISRFPSNRFYEGKLRDGPNVVNESFDRLAQSLLYGPYMFLNVHGVEMANDKHSETNFVEVEVVMHLLQKLKQNGVQLEVGIISPYAGQVEAIETRLGSWESKSLKVEARSVDGFQGREKDVIILSTVRSNTGGNIGFLDDYQRLNVSITRAKYAVCIVGNSSTLGANEGVWNDLISDARSRSCFMDGSSDPDLNSLIRRAQLEVQQLESLANPHSNLFFGTKWKVVFSREFRASLTRMPAKYAKQMILNTVLNLANGSLGPRMKFKASVSPLFDYIHIQIAWKRYLVWSVDLDNDDTLQIIKLWDVVELQELPRIVKRLKNLFLTYTSAYLERCKMITSTRNPVLPAKWEMDEKFVRYKPLLRSSSSSSSLKASASTASESTGGESSSVAESLPLMKFYSMSSGIARQLLISSEGTSIDYPFEITKQEYEVVT